MAGFPKYTWVGNRISESDMAKLYRLKQIKRKPITCLVAEAVRQFLEKENCEGIVPIPSCKQERLVKK